MPMDQEKYKDFKTSRGYNYHYFYSAPAEGKSTLLLLHGFPTNSLDWDHVVDYFSKKGYGAIVPDLLGYAGTDKPTDPWEYRLKLMAQDISEILEAEKAQRVISLAHDWGCGLNARLANYYGEKFEAFGFFAVPYSPPLPFDLAAINAMSKQVFGYDNFGYWNFFAKEEAAKIIEEHFESFVCLLYPKNEEVFRNNFCRDGALEKWLLSDSKCESTPIAISKKGQTQQRSLLEGGLSAPLCWYKAMVQGLTPSDNKDIPEDAHILKKPVFFGAALHDPTSPAPFTKASMTKYCSNCTLIDFNTSHWVLEEAPDKVNEELDKWLDTLGIESAKL